jgi:organic radical activating enzyme
VAVFCRFAGCNLWTGREKDRLTGSGGCSRWCDTDFVGTDGEGGDKFTSPLALADAALRTWGHELGQGPRPLLVCTGGEPLLQLDAPLVDAFHDRGFEIAIETNGTLPDYLGLEFSHWFLQPKDGPNKEADLQLALNYCLANPQWRLSLQSHKFIGIS